MGRMFEGYVQIPFISNEGVFLVCVCMCVYGVCVVCVCVYDSYFILLIHFGMVSCVALDWPRIAKARLEPLNCLPLSS